MKLYSDIADDFDGDFDCVVIQKSNRKMVSPVELFDNKMSSRLNETREPLNIWFGSHELHSYNSLKIHSHAVYARHGITHEINDN